jgi:lysophospholipase L1-like esterase
MPLTPAEPAPHPPSLPRWKRLLFWAILLGGLLLTLEVTAQLYLRVARGYAGGSFLQYQFDPYKNIHPTRGWVDTRGVVHNAQGFRRDEDVPRIKPPGTLRVFLMGASTAYGTGGLWPHLQRDFAVLRNSETIDAYLEEALQEEFPDRRVEVINAAIPSVWTHHHLIYLNQTILGYEPDLILFLDGLNDHFHFDRNHDQFASYAYSEQSRVIMGPPTLTSLATMNGWWLFRVSAAAHVSIRAAQGVKALIRRPPPPAPIQVDEALEALQEVFAANALRMIERNAAVLTHEGVPALFMLQPMLVLERERLPRMPEIERRLFAFNLEATPENYEAYIRGATPRVTSMVRESVESLGARFLDLTGVYREVEGEQIFTDYAHLTPLGNRLLAERILDAVLPLLHAGDTAPSGAVSP